jgi:dTMP kinase
MKPNSGLFLSFEGNEGSGKSTQIDLLAERLREAGHPVSQWREPGGTALGEALRPIIKTPAQDIQIGAMAELLLISASRAQLVNEIIVPRLERGEIILVDRFLDSTLVYQGFGRGLATDLVQQAVALAVGDTFPHRTFLLKVPLEVSEARRQHRALALGETKPDRFEASDRTFFERIEQGYDQLAAKAPNRIQSIDATQSVAEVHAEIWQSVKALLALRA